MAYTTSQPDRHVLDLLDAYALGMLEEKAADEVERHLQHCEQCSHALHQSREVAALLLLAPKQVAPPASLKGRILASIAQDEAQQRQAAQSQRPAPQQPQAGEVAQQRRAERPPVEHLSVERPPEERPLAAHPPAAPERVAEEASLPEVAIPLPEVPPARRGWKGWMGRLFAGRGEPPAAGRAAGRQQRAGAELPEEHIETILRLLHAPHAAMWELAGTPEAPQAHARLLGSPEEQTAVLLVSGLEPLPPERDYQLWFLREGKPVGSVVFDVRQNGQGQMMVRAPRQLAHYDLAAITPEPAGGSPGPTGPIMIAGELKAA